MAVREVLVCDECGRDGDVETYCVTFPDGTEWEIDLDGDHAGPLKRFRGDKIGKLHVKKRGRTRQTMRETKLSDLV